MTIVRTELCWSTSIAARLAATVLVAGLLTGCASRAPLTSSPPPDAALPNAATLRTQTGLASFYGPGFQGRLTASGTRFDRRDDVAAHPRFPFGTRVRVTNLSNGRTVTVTIVDRGPADWVTRQGVIIDLSQGAAEKLGFIRSGRQRVRLDVVRWGERPSPS